MTLSGYNMQTGIRTIVDAQVQSPGRIVLSARLFGEMIRKMPDDVIVFAADENLSVHLTCGDASFEILGLSADDYPELPEVDDEYSGHPPGYPEGHDQPDQLRRVHQREPPRPYRLPV